MIHIHIQYKLPGITEIEKFDPPIKIIPEMTRKSGGGKGWRAEGNGAVPGGDESAQLLLRHASLMRRDSDPHSPPEEIYSGTVFCFCD